jgi:predicted dehydrogenase
LQIIGTKGVIDLRVDEEPLVHLLPGNPFRPVSNARKWQPITTAGVDKPEPIAALAALVGAHRLPARDLITAIRENREPLCGPEEGRTTVEMIMAVFASHVRGGESVTLPLSLREHPLKA